MYVCTCIHACIVIHTCIHVHLYTYILCVRTNGCDVYGAGFFCLFHYLPYRHILGTRTTGVVIVILFVICM